MFFKKIKLFRLLGFEVGIDASWLVLAALVVWTLAKGYFPYLDGGFSASTYWIMGVIGALGLFASIVVHEFSHSLVARSHGMVMRGITLFIFGGVAEMTDEPPSAGAEFLMAAAGPLTSFLLGAGFYAAYLMGVSGAWPEPVTAVLGYLAFINVVLGAFNLVPAFPLDGGRLLRAALWKAKNDLSWATRLSSRVGTAFGILLIVLGGLQVFRGDFVSGMWWFLIGMFVQTSARGSYQQHLTRQALDGIPVRRLMKSEPVTVPSSVTVQELVERYVYEHHFKMFPVADHGQLTGCVTTRRIKEVPRDIWETTRVGEIASPCSTENSVEADADALDALKTMSRNQASRLLVRDHDRVVGVVTLKDLMGFISLKMELEN
jgi:Zn-dependent protease/predicted transcriptional regulator